MLIDLAWSLIVPLYAVLGYGWVSRFHCELNVPLKFAFGAALSFSSLQLLGVILCITNALTPTTVWIGIIGIGLGLGAGLVKRPFPPITWLIPLVVLAPIVLLALPEPWMRDSLTYHLALPKLYANFGGYVETDRIIFQHFPLGWQSLLSLFYCIGENGNALFNPRLISAWLAGFVALMTSGICLQVGGTLKMALASGLALLTVPTFIEFSASSYAMTWLMLLTSGAFAGGFIQGKKGAILSGSCIGLACSVKLSGLFLIPLGIGLFWSRKEEWRTIGLLTCTFGSVFYIRNAIVHGNPLFPLYTEWLGGEGWSLWQSFAYDMTLSNYGMGRETLDWIALPFRLLGSHQLDPYDFEGSLGPSVTAALLIFGFMGFREQTKWRGRAWFLIVGWFVLWAIQVQQVRFFMPIVPFLLAIGFSHLKGSGKKNESLSAILLIASMAWAIPFYKQMWNRQRTGDALTGQLDKTEFLYRQLPENYPATAALNEMSVTKVWMVWMRGYVYHLDKPFKVDSVLGAYRFEDALDQSKSISDFMQQMADENISHIAINHRFFLVDENAEVNAAGIEESGRTHLLQTRFNALIQSKAIYVLGDYPPVRIYGVQSLD